MDNSSSSTQPEGSVGLFWDYDSIPHFGENELTVLIQKLNDFCGGLKGNEKSSFNTKVLYHHVSKNTEFFQKFGFEVIEQDGDSWPSLDSGASSITAYILMWLWDLERFDASVTADNDSDKPNKNKEHVIMLISDNEFFSPLLKNILHRGVRVVWFSSLAALKKHLAEESCLSSIDIKQFIAESERFSPCDIFKEKRRQSDASLSDVENRGSNSSTTTTETESSSSLTTGVTSLLGANDGKKSIQSEQTMAQLESSYCKGNINFSKHMHTIPEDQHFQHMANYEENPSNRQLPMSSVYLSRGSSDGDPDLLVEQQALYDDLVSAVYTNNVKSAVATLRKMYTRQTRSYRIPSLLSMAMPDTASMIGDRQIDLFHVSVKFTIDCIQWCIGIQLGDNAECFKYKMNKNIARWILKEAERKGLPSPASQATVGMVVSLLKNILVDATELDFALEVLTSFNVPRPLQYLVPYITSWMTANPTLQQHLDFKALERFLVSHPEMQSFLSHMSPAASPRDLDPVKRSSFSSVASSSSSNSSSVSPRTWEDCHGAHVSGLGLSDGVLSHQPASDGWARDTTAQHEAFDHVFKHFSEFSDRSSKLHGFDNSRQAYTQSSSSNGQSLETKLLKLLMRSNKGELGARIPALYRDEYGEPLRLRGRKLKDILLETGLVEMLGTDGPGDKLFRIISNPGSLDHSGDLGSAARVRSSGVRGNPRSYDHLSPGAGGLRAAHDSSSRFGDIATGSHQRPNVPSLLGTDYQGDLSALLTSKDGLEDSSRPGSSRDSFRQPFLASNPGSARRDSYSSDMSPRSPRDSGSSRDNGALNFGSSSSLVFGKEAPLDSFSGNVKPGTFSELGLSSSCLMPEPPEYNHVMSSGPSGTGDFAM